MNFNAIQDKIVIDRVSDSILQLSFKILPHVEFWVVSKKIFHSYLKKLLKFSSLFQHLCEAGFFFLYILKPMYHNRLSADACMRIQLCSVKSELLK